MNRLRLDSLCQINPESLGAETPAEFTFDYIDISSVTLGHIDLSYVLRTRYTAAPSRARRRIHTGDVLLCTVRPGLKAHARITTDSEVPRIASTGFAVLRPNVASDTSYIFHQLFSDDVSAQLRAMETGSNYPAVNERDVSRISFYCPRPEERESIAAVLDTVDAAIAKTQAVIAKLKHIRAGLLHDLLTRGLDHNGQLRDPDRHPEQFKDSPLGRIPKEWNLEPLGKVLADIYDYRGRTPLKLGMEWGGGDISALSANNVEMGRVNFSKETYYGSPALYRRWMTNGDVKKSDVLITTEAPLGNIAQIPDEKRYILSQRVVLLRPKQEILTSDYLALQMMGARFQKELIRNSSGSTAVGIQRSKLEQIMLLVPDNEDEQKHSAQVIRDQDNNIDTMERELSKLQSLKSGVMTDLLTGRVRVPDNIDAMEAAV